jgi:hypothetical protein
MEGVKESLVEIPKDWMLSIEELVAAQQRRHATLAESAAAGALNPSGTPVSAPAPALADSTGSLDGAIAIATGIDKIVEKVKKDFIDNG